MAKISNARECLTGISCSNYASAHYRACDKQNETLHLPAMQAIAYGGGKMPHAVIEQAMSLMPHVNFTNAYGLTETSSTICLLDPDDHREAFESEDQR